MSHIFRNYLRLLILTVVVSGLGWLTSASNLQAQSCSDPNQDCIDLCEAAGENRFIACHRTGNPCDPSGFQNHESNCSSTGGHCGHGDLGGQCDACGNGIRECCIIENIGGTDVATECCTFEGDTQNPEHCDNQDSEFLAACREEECDDGNNDCNANGQQEECGPNCELDPCNDENDCTTDTCEEEGTCSNTPDDSNCDDGIECTTDTCDEVLGCMNDPDDSACDDGLFCNGEETCGDGCEDGEDPCTGGTPFCDEPTDTCLECETNQDCDDSLFCNGAETCVEGFCQAGTTVDCDDSVSCTDDSCNETTDQCDNTANDANCDNGDFCDGSETCDPQSDCQSGTPVDCSDGVSCTNDSCNEETDQCDSVADNSNCDDQIDCTVDTCDAQTGCTNEPDDSTCNDQDPCTDDFCEEGVGCANEVLTDADDDGVHDNCDECANGNDTVDTDNDGTADACDDCPDDPDKTVEGICGCDVAETDFDEDGVIDCIDNCPPAELIDELPADQVADLQEQFGMATFEDLLDLLEQTDTSNPDQADSDDNGIGDACEEFIEEIQLRVGGDGGACTRNENEEGATQSASFWPFGLLLFPWVPLGAVRMASRRRKRIC